MQVKLVPYVLYARYESLGANQSIEVQLGLGGYDFILSQISGVATSSFRFNVVPNDTNRRLFNQTIEAVTVFSSVSAPVPLRIDGGPFQSAESMLNSALRVKRSSTITVELLDTSGATNTIQLALFGFEVQPA